MSYRRRNICYIKINIITLSRSLCRKQTIQQLSFGYEFSISWNKYFKLWFLVCMFDMYIYRTSNEVVKLQDSFTFAYIHLHGKQIPSDFHGYSHHRINWKNQQKQTNNKKSIQSEQQKYKKNTLGRLVFLRIHYFHSKFERMNSSQ